MKIAVPIAEGRMSPHFGRCEGFALIEADPVARKILDMKTISAPPHERGAFPALLHQHGVTHVIVSGMGPRAVEMLHEHGIVVITGALADGPEEAVQAFLAGNLQTGESPCDHGEGHGCASSGE